MVSLIKWSSSDWRRFCCPIGEANRTHSQSYVEDLPKKQEKRCAKMVVLNLSVLPIVSDLL